MLKINKSTRQVTFLLIVIPLTFLFVFFRDGSHEWISWLSFSFLFCIGAFGGIRGFLRYRIGTSAGPILRSKVNHFVRGNASSARKWPAAVVFVSVVCAIVCGVLSSLSIIIMTEGYGAIQTNQHHQITVKRPATYSLWCPADNKADIDRYRQIQMVPVGTSAVVTKQIPNYSAVFHRNGDKYYLVCNFKFESAGTYSITNDFGLNISNLVFDSQITLANVILVFTGFAAGFLFAALAVVVFFVGDQWVQIDVKGS